MQWSSSHTPTTPTGDAPVPSQNGVDSDGKSSTSCAPTAQKEPKIDPSQLPSSAESAKQEQTDAGRVLGLKSIEFLDFPDGYLEPTISLRREIVRVIRKHRPHILITNNPTRDLTHSNHIGHPDHFAAGEAALSAVFPSARDHLWDESLLTQGLDSWKVHEVWVMMFGEGGSHWNPLEEQDIEKAIGAIKSHVSQLDEPENVHKWMRRWRSEHGKKADAPFAEGFKRFQLVPGFTPDDDENQDDEDDSD